jgi:hypothetical protein
MPRDTLETMFKHPGPRGSRPASSSPKSPSFLHVTVLISPDDVQRADQLYEANGFRTRHQMLQWLILYGLKALETGRISPRTQSKTIVEVAKP